jgi:hypothetical protein
MPRTREQPEPSSPNDAPRPWQTGEEYAQEARLFAQAAEQFIGRGEDLARWSLPQRLRLRLAHLIECADYSESGQKALQQMLKVAEGVPGFEYRWLAVQSVHAWAGSWKLPQWQATTEARRACLSHLVAALEAFDNVFAQLRHDLDRLAVKLDAYSQHAQDFGQKSAERILAELVVEGADALGFVVEPREPMQAEVLRIERQLELAGSLHALPAAPTRDSKVLRKAMPKRSSPANELPTTVSDPSDRDRAR